MLQRLGRAWHKHGWRLFGPLLALNARHYWRRYREFGRLGMPLSSVDDIPGVETHKPVYLTALVYDGASAADAQPYEPIADQDFHSALDALPPDRHRMTFVDLGSGKGRALLLAAQAGFGRIIGVEYSADLHVRATKNVAAAAKHLPGVNRITLLNADAGDFTPPKGRVVYYLFNPFGGQVMGRVLDRLGQAVQQDQFQDLWVLYGNPVHESLLASRGFLQKVTHRAGIAVYRIHRHG
jgi:predicted RNA methylase